MTDYVNFLTALRFPLGRVKNGGIIPWLNPKDRKSITTDRRGRRNTVQPSKTLTPTLTPTRKTITPSSPWIAALPPDLLSATALLGRKGSTTIPTPTPTIRATRVNRIAVNVLYSLTTTTTTKSIRRIKDVPSSTGRRTKTRIATATTSILP